MNSGINVASSFDGECRKDFVVNSVQAGIVLGWVTIKNILIQGLMNGIKSLQT